MAPFTTPPRISGRELTSVWGDPISLSDPDSLTHIQFRRFAGCPICNLHLQSFVRRHDEVRAAGVREVVFFHSTAAELRDHTTDLPFVVIADPDKHVYREFGVETSRRALLHPKVWWAVLYGTTLSALGRHKLPTVRQKAGRLGLPADILVDRGGRVVAAKYGSHADDQWSVDELLAQVSAARA